ncbi:hypothetical protein HFO63_23630 [Rhizobium laguerreae]|uniref:hypothetical protein n=1 Tax=Rhizobium laguerreae TaxID=1076926 RepID=UPI001C8FCC75|nr:hypothetical protein [Rhizobium laguerreae]MBY3088915.1 hypothetical protein [Rhizobium laguerreae]MBY3148537.1 hypothetical protein [Rhizobium laguerreae]
MAFLTANTLTASEVSPECHQATRQYLGLLLEEVQGTRFEPIIKKDIEANGGMEKKLNEMTSRMSKDDCAFLMSAPESALRSLATSGLPADKGRYPSGWKNPQD